MSISWIEITLNNQIYLEKAFQLYDRSFPIEVREPHQILLNSLQYAEKQNANHFHFLIGLEKEELVSLATAHYLAEVNAGFIVYLAVSENRRKKGLGSRTLQQMERLLNEDAALNKQQNISAISLETEKYEEGSSMVEKEACEKRNLFFKKNSYQVYDEIHYFQPPLHGEGACVPLNLLIKTMGKEFCTKEECREIIKAMYREKYAGVNGIDKKILSNCWEEMFKE
ncbi:GNAT family N-acetyltransferase [Bacillus benzoevorans]|uniref:GNAT superfamily N-acetyltransferase n=1 Tax=Bacillus benzoevorans TaxID=1456 RepID=A0A7X0HR79_9BACI|nr:GNAT family N-acetyltransferase [Bacillus benzoevorans]MBB6445344.1 GNAT superfamily N-acetyltransferase [Bacillus benzoevorans]